MATAHILQVPVEALEIIELPGIKWFTQRESVESRSRQFRTMLTLKTNASAMSFKRQAATSSIRIIDEDTFLEDGGYYTGEDGRLVIDPDQCHCAVVKFRVHLNNRHFSATYNYRRHLGYLRAMENEERYQ